MSQQVKNLLLTKSSSKVMKGNILQMSVFLHKQNDKSNLSKLVSQLLCNVVFLHV